jgi:hypothetical protein
MTSPEGARAHVSTLVSTGNTNAPAVMIAECAAEFITGIPARRQDQHSVGGRAKGGDARVPW